MQVPQISSPRVKEIINHADVLFRAERNTLDKKFQEALRAGRSAARQTHNAGALVPAEAKCYLARNRDLIVGYATALATAHTSFSEPAGKEADNVLAHFAALTVAGSRLGFLGQADLTARRTGKPNSQAPLAAGGFESEAGEALDEGRKILDVQRVQIKNRPPAPPIIQHVYNATGPNSRISINSSDCSINLAVRSSGETTA